MLFVEVVLEEAALPRLKLALVVVVVVVVVVVAAPDRRNQFGPISMPSGFADCSFSSRLIQLSSKKRFD